MIRPSARLEAMIERMELQNLTDLPVTTSDGRLVGLLTPHDAQEACEGSALVPITASPLALASVHDPAVRGTVGEAHGHAAFSYRGGDVFDRVGPHVADREHAGQAGLEEIWASALGGPVVV
jgi:hypothetical protein